MNIIPFKDRGVERGMRVQVYLNLHKVDDDGQRWYSIRDKASGRVVAHADSLALHNAYFHVNEAGRDRVRLQKRKNVHAWVEGDIPSIFTIKQHEPVRYNPYRDDQFMKGDEPITHAKQAYMGPNGKVVAL